MENGKFWIRNENQDNDDEKEEIGPVAHLLTYKSPFSVLGNLHYIDILQLLVIYQWRLLIFVRI